MLTLTTTSYVCLYRNRVILGAGQVCVRLQAFQYQAAEHFEQPVHQVSSCATVQWLVVFLCPVVQAFTQCVQLEELDISWNPFRSFSFLGDLQEFRKLSALTLKLTPVPCFADASASCVQAVMTDLKVTEHTVKTTVLCALIQQ